MNNEKIEVLLDEIQFVDVSNGDEFYDENTRQWYFKTPVGCVSQTNGDIKHFEMSDIVHIPYIQYND